MRKACGDRSLAEANELLYRGGAALANSSSTLVYPAMSDETPTTTPEPTLENLNALANWLIPTPVRMDCFFVTLAVLLGTNVNALSSSLGMPVPQPGSTGVQSSQIVQALVSLGLAFRVWTFREPENGGGGPIRGRERGVSERHWGSIAGMPNTVGIGYRRPDRTGHVVICRSESSPSLKVSGLLTAPAFIDNQERPTADTLTSSRAGAGPTSLATSQTRKSSLCFGLTRGPRTGGSSTNIDAG